MESKAMKVPASVWIVGALALLWNLVGVAAFVMQVAMPAEALGAMPAEQRAIYEATPAWLYVFYGLATFGGVAGSIGLLLRRRWAVPVYLLALVALVLQVVASYAVPPAWSVSGAAGLAFPVLLVAIAICLWLFSRRMAARGVLRRRARPCRSGLSRELLSWPLPQRRQGEAGRGCSRFELIVEDTPDRKSTRLNSSH